MLLQRLAQIDLLGRRGSAADGTSNCANRSANRHTGRTRDCANRRATPSAHAGTAGAAVPRRIAASCEKDGGPQGNRHAQRSQYRFHAAYLRPRVDNRPSLCMNDPSPFKKLVRQEVAAHSLAASCFLARRTGVGARHCVAPRYAMISQSYEPKASSPSSLTPAATKTP